MVCLAVSVSAVPCQQLHHQAGHSPDSAFSSYLQDFQMCAMTLCLTGFVVGPSYDILDHFLKPAEYLVPIAQDLANTLQAYLSQWFNTRKQ